MAEDKGVKKMTLEDRLGLVRYKPDHHNHIKILDPKVCIGCKGKPCTTVCPAGVYVWEESNQKIVVGYENCIECGAARMMCPLNNLQWDPPRGGFGVAYQYG